MDLPERVLHGVYAYGFLNPSQIQALAIAPIVRGRSVIAQAQSGTGKTGAFAIGILARVDPASRATQALVLSPTRELADQTFQVFQSLGGEIEGLRISMFTGGTRVDDSRHEAITGPTIAVATPGRALDLIQTGYLRCENLRVGCMDEADELLKRGLDDKVQEIVSYFSEDVQFLLFSATIPLAAFSMMEQFMPDPVKILVRAEKLTLEGIRQFFVNVEETDLKFATLTDLYGGLSIQKAIIFANTKEAVDELQEGFEDNSFPVP
jgi:translation initiation factor 4A